MYLITLLRIHVRYVFYIKAAQKSNTSKYLFYNKYIHVAKLFISLIYILCHINTFYHNKINIWLTRQFQISNSISCVCPYQSDTINYSLVLYADIDMIIILELSRKKTVLITKPEISI